MKTRRIGLVIFVLIMAVLACNFPASNNAPNSDATSIHVTLSILATTAFAPQATATLVESATVSAPTNTELPSVTPTPQNPLVLRDTLCWMGPGSVYDVVSALKKDTRVELLGQGSIPGWWIVKNPIYHDPCWVQQKDLQIDAEFNLSGLKKFNPPPTPTPTKTPEPTPTS